MKLHCPAAMALSLACAALALPAFADTPAQLLATYTAQAGGAPPVPARGRRMFTTEYKNELGLSCSSCHGPVPVTPGKDQVTDKPIAPMAPAANPKRFTDPQKTEFWFRLNCKDFVGRACTAAEKADLISWLISLKP